MVRELCGAIWLRVRRDSTSRNWMTTSLASKKRGTDFGRVGVHGFWVVASRKVRATDLTNIGSRGLGPRLYWAADVVLVVVSVPVLSPTLTPVLAWSAHRRPHFTE